MAGDWRTSIQMKRAKLSLHQIFLEICASTPKLWKFLSYKNITMEILIVLMLILLNGIFSMSEIALVSAKSIRLEADAKKGSVRAKAALELASSPSRFLSTVQIGITLIGIFTGIYSGENITTDLREFFDQFALLQPYSNVLAVGTVVVTVTYFTLVLGELVPKRIGLNNPEKVAKLVARPMSVLSVVAAPFVWFLTFSGDLIMKMLNIKPSDNTVTEEEIKAMVEEGAKGGEVRAIEQDIVERVFHLGDRRVGSLMTHRSDVVYLNIMDDVQTIRSTVIKETHSIYPVYESDKDNVVGVVSLKDLFTYLADADFSLAKHFRPAHYITETTSAYQALAFFKEHRVHYAIVTDEFGTAQGLITMNDLLEALVGDFNDPDAEDYGIQQREDGTWLVDGHYPFHDFLRYFNITYVPASNDFYTVGGLIFKELERIPKEGEKLIWENLEIEIIDMDNVKIDKVSIRKM